MSWDFNLGDFDENYTYNVSPMYYLAFGDPGIRKLDGMKGAEALPHLLVALDYFEEHESALREMNPENGWGDYAGALGLLRGLADACRHFPQERIHIS